MRKKLYYILIITIFFISCQIDLDHSQKKWFTQSSIEEIIIPEIYVSDGGIQNTPKPEGSVYYYNGSRDKSDVQLDDSLFYKQTVKRYIRVSGIAVPYESGFTNRFYHSVLFMIKNLISNKTRFFSIPVDNKNRFTGYLYFDETGDYKVYSFRAQNDILYPRYNSLINKLYVLENSSTLVFNVNVIEKVPVQYIHLLPTRNVNNGNKYLRDYTINLTKDLTNDIDKVKRIFEFLVFGDDNSADTSDDFIYSNYGSIYPELTDISYEDIFISSHFLNIRKGVCNDFAELFCAMTRTLGYKVKKVSGSEPSTGNAHMWNIIDLTGDENIWLRLDSTWANLNKNGSYRNFAEFYPEFNELTFIDDHDNKFTLDFKKEY